DVCDPQGQDQRVGSGGNTDCKTGSTELRDFDFQFAHTRAQNKLLGLENGVQGSLDLFADRGILGFQVQHGDVLRLDWGQCASEIEMYSISRVAIGTRHAMMVNTVLVLHS